MKVIDWACDLFRSIEIGDVVLILCVDAIDDDLLLLGIVIDGGALTLCDDAIDLYAPNSRR